MSLINGVIDQGTLASALPNGGESVRPLCETVDDGSLIYRQHLQQQAQEALTRQRREQQQQEAMDEESL